MRALAASKGGLCLSTEWKGRRVKLLWRCDKGHVWEAHSNSVENNGTWCSACHGNRKMSLREAQALAAKHGGTCQSKTYSTNATPLEWQCSEGHVWRASMDQVNKGAWCPTCRQARVPTPQEACALAALKGGSCLTREIRHSRQRLEWVCASGHTLKATYHAVQDQGKWCPCCEVAEKRRLAAPVPRITKHIQVA